MKDIFYVHIILLTFGTIFFIIINSTDSISVWLKMSLDLNFTMIALITTQFSIYTSVLNANMEMLQTQLEAFYKYIDPEFEQKLTLTTKMKLYINMVKIIIEASDTLNKVYGWKVDAYFLLFLTSTLKEMEMVLLIEDNNLGKHIFDICFMQVS